MKRIVPFVLLFISSCLLAQVSEKDSVMHITNELGEYEFELENTNLDNNIAVLHPFNKIPGLESASSFQTKFQLAYRGVVFNPSVFIDDVPFYFGSNLLLLSSPHITKVKVLAGQANTMSYSDVESNIGLCIYTKATGTEKGFHGFGETQVYYKGETDMSSQVFSHYNNIGMSYGSKNYESRLVYGYDNMERTEDGGMNVHNLNFNNSWSKGKWKINQSFILVNDNMESDYRENITDKANFMKADVSYDLLSLANVNVLGARVANDLTYSDSGIKKSTEQRQQYYRFKFDLNEFKIWNQQIVFGGAYHLLKIDQKDEVDRNSRSIEMDRNRLSLYSGVNLFKFLKLKYEWNRTHYSVINKELNRDLWTLEFNFKRFLFRDNEKLTKLGVIHKKNGGELFNDTKVFFNEEEEQGQHRDLGGFEQSFFVEYNKSWELRFTRFNSRTEYPIPSSRYNVTGYTVMYNSSSRLESTGWEFCVQNKARLLNKIHLNNSFFLTSYESEVKMLNGEQAEENEDDTKKWSVNLLSQLDIDGFSVEVNMRAMHNNFFDKEVVEKFNDEGRGYTSDPYSSYTLETSPRTWFGIQHLSLNYLLPVKSSFVKAVRLGFSIHNLTSTDGSWYTSTSAPQSAIGWSDSHSYYAFRLRLDL